MKALTCEMCGSTDILKQDGVYVCQACGTKYTVEEAKKMMVEGTVEVKGTVTIDTSAEVTNLLELLRREMEMERYKDASKTCKMILLRDPNNWEAVYCDSITKYIDTDVSELSELAPSINKSFRYALELAKAQLGNDAAEEVVQSMSEKVIMASKQIEAMIMDEMRNSPNKYRHTSEISDIMESNSEILLTYGDDVDEVFGFKNICVSIWEIGIEGRIDSMKKKDYVEKIKAADPDYTPSQAGCYIATAAYGTYDCPEVWTLRRYRDFVLALTPFGRRCIKLYYAVSPRLVSWFGHSSNVRKFVRRILDGFVQKLQARGIDSTPYDDFNW